MHGNTEHLSSGIKVIKLSAIIEEIKSSFLIHKKIGSQLNAIHLEITHQDVTECLDYTFADDSVTDLTSHRSLMAPRLNYAQTIHVIQCIAKHYVQY